MNFFLFLIYFNLILVTKAFMQFTTHSETWGLKHKSKKGMNNFFATKMYQNRSKLSV